MYKIRSIDDAQQRLYKTVVIHDGEPIFVDKVVGAQEVEGVNLITRKRKRFVLNPTSTLPPQVGFVNHEGYAIFITRRPVRRVRQGLCTENISTTVGSREEVIRSSSFGKMLTRDYPNIPKCISMVKKGEARGAAFSLDFAVFDDGRLYYQTSRVGAWKEDGTLTLDPKFKCLQEVLDVQSK